MAEAAAGDKMDTAAAADIIYIDGNVGPHLDVYE